MTHATARDLFAAIGDTPLIRLHALSEAIGRTILGKAEHLNPGGSVKDRAAKRIVLDAESSGRLSRGGTIVEGTAGNTGIALAMLAASRGYTTIVTIPDDQSREKIDLLRLFGADVRPVPVVSFADPAHYYHAARRIAESIPGALWADQFDNLSNFRAHYDGTGPEIWSQTGGVIDAFACAAGTGGTFAGVSSALKERRPDIRTVLIDPAGSSLYAYVRCGTLDLEGESITEGIGIKRITENFKRARYDDAIRVDDLAGVEMLHYLLRNEGLLLGGSAGINVVGAARIALGLAPGSTVVTILCDGGTRYQSRLYDKAWLAAHGLTPQAKGLEFL